MNPADFQVGDLVFICIDFYPFRKVAQDSLTWTNHVGIVTRVADDVQIAESTVPFSRLTTLKKFIRRSKDGRFTVKRLAIPIEEAKINAAVKKRLGILYDTGFNLLSKKQFCSRFVHEVLFEATGVTVGEVETLRELFSKNPAADLRFWRLWYFLSIPWNRQTVTPASVFNDLKLELIFET